MNSVLRLCPKCGAEVPIDAPDGGCPGCLLETGLDLLSNGQALNDSVESKANAWRARAVDLLGEMGDYELLEEVGRGAQGAVYRARQKSLNRIVALKIISLGQWASAAHLKRFRREAEAAASLDHPGLVPIYEVGERAGLCYFSMKFVEGGQLDEVFRSASADSSGDGHNSLPLRRAAELVAKIARTVP